MTWNKVIQTGDIEEYFKKAEGQNYVYVIYDDGPYRLAVDIAYSFYEIAYRYGVPLRTVETAVHQHSRLRNRYFIEKVYTE